MCHDGGGSPARPQHRHRDPVDRDLEEGDQQQSTWSGGQPLRARRRDNSKKRSCIEQLGQGARRKLGARLACDDILHVVKVADASSSLVARARGRRRARRLADDTASSCSIPATAARTWARRASTGLHEKQLTLAIANARRRSAARARHRRSQLTRTDDRTLTLRQRVAIAEPRARRPVRLDPRERVADPHPARLRDLRADRRAASTSTAARCAATPRRRARASTPTIALVLDDVERGAAQWEAADLAARMQRALRDRRGDDGDRGVRQDAPARAARRDDAGGPRRGRLHRSPDRGQASSPSPRVQAQLADAIAEAIDDQLADQ